MNTDVEVFRGHLHYEPGLVLHTASSGSVPYLDELYLRFSTKHETLALGGVRTNVEYLTQISGDKIEKQVIDWLSSVDLSNSFSALLDMAHKNEMLSPPARALLDQTLHDGIAREQGIPICDLWGHSHGRVVDTNQTLFWSEDDTMLGLARRYVARGFKTLKLRLGVGTFDDDLRRLGKLRDEFGDSVSLSGDVNGQWSDDDVLSRMVALEPYDLSYIEQPVSKTSWTMIKCLAKQSKVPVMLDESMASSDDVNRVISIGGQLAAHLKLIKFGGLRPLIAAGKKLNAAGIPIMIGQMNEGALATAAAAHAAIILQASGNELYGADGIIDDPAETPKYQDGNIILSEAPGIGLAFNASKLTTCWERTINTRVTKDQLQHQLV
jgi:L-alanine-DL-glutamate epimerase-like enolase superfamily enzyme